MIDSLAPMPKEGTQVAWALSVVGLIDLSTLEIRVGYSGLGQRLHVYIGSPDVREGKGIWVKACEGSSWSGHGKPATSDNQRLEKEYQAGARANCWRCARALGVIDCYVGIEERRRIEKKGGPFASYQEAADSHRKESS